MDEVSREVYLRFLTEANLCPEPVEIAMTIQEFGAEPTDKRIEEIRDLLFEDFMNLVEPKVAMLDSLFEE